MSNFGCVGNTIRLLSGGYIDLAAPRPEDIDIRDIAGALSKICRFGGQCPVFYSVAEHCCRATWLSESRGYAIAVCSAVLMHDAAEAYLGDIVKPLKILLPEYARLEALMERAIAVQFGLEDHSEVVGEIDRTMLISERRALFGDDGVKWAGEDEVRPVELSDFGWSPRRAARIFLETSRRIV